ncbi:MAG: AtpZ/AtpI family protein [Nocardioidaceae bacterium]
MSESPPPPPSGDPFVAFGYLVGGAAFYGGLGWLLDQWLETAILFPVGLLFGIALAMYLVFKLYLNAA